MSYGQFIRLNFLDYNSKCMYDNASPTKAIDIRDVRISIQKILQHLVGSRSFYKVPESSRRFQQILEGSRTHHLIDVDAGVVVVEEHLDHFCLAFERRQVKRRCAFLVHDAWRGGDIACCRQQKFHDLPEKKTKLESGTKLLLIKIYLLWTLAS